MAGSESTQQEEISTLYSDHYGWLYAWLRNRLSSNSVDAADLTQDTFVRILTRYRAEAIPVLRAPRAYLKTVARHLLVNHYERRSLEQAYQNSLLLVPEPLVPSAEERAILLETLQELDALLSALPVKVRNAFLMSQLEGMSYEEIAARLRVSVRTVTRYMAQGFKQCLQLMLTQQT